jgi:hypothetical protein
LKKWFKQLLIIIALVVVGGSCFYLGNRSGYREGYDKGFGYHALATNRAEALSNVYLLNHLRTGDLIKSENFLETKLEMNVISVMALERGSFNDGAGNCMQKIADYIKENPIKKEPDPFSKMVINDFIVKYGSK